ncbi:hypothetical protein BT69DRAFT_1265418 [Atractiella rhizophila]|nr:hypothetical protein BT69DRAFT_1265418 [Atractiella rhizophila]
MAGVTSALSMGVVPTHRASSLRTTGGPNSTSSSEAESPSASPVLSAVDVTQWIPKKAPLKSASGRWEDFLWIEKEEPHKSRKKAILKAHPEVVRLMGPEPLTKYVVLAVVALQIAIAYSFRNQPIFSWKFMLTAYAIGGSANQNLFLAIHEITHNLAFNGVKANRIFAWVANLPIGLPYAMMFKKYHMEHHRYLGEDGVDTDIPSRLEAWVLSNRLGKLFFCTCQILFYAIRPGMIKSIPFTRWTFFNMAFQFTFVYFLVEHFACWNSWLYLLISTFFAGSLHPLAAHFIAEHYLWEGLDMETWSYYGWLNIFCYNVGYHNEHHDFPSVPWTRLPELSRIAKEFYEPLPQHRSWPMVIVNFILRDDEQLWSRAKRENRMQKGKVQMKEEGVAGGMDD